MVVQTDLQILFRNVLQQGTIPNHIGIILDGNRRYARERNLETVEGHKKGCQLLDPVIDWSILCGVKEITMYIFSIKNFDREPEEVAGILGVIRDDIKRILANLKDSDVNGRARYQYFGDWSLYPEDMRELMATLMEKTKNNTKIKVNMAFVYTGRNEITAGVNALLGGLNNKNIELSNVDEILFDQSLQLYPLSPVDLIIRTGECRLSEFLSWNIDENCILCFRNQYWPTFTYWDFLACIFHFQIARFKASDTHEKHNGKHPDGFLKILKKNMWEKVFKNITHQESFDSF